MKLGQKADMLVRDSIGRVVMAVEVKGRPLPADALGSQEWAQLLSVRSELGSPYALLFSPGKCAFVGPVDQTIIFNGQTVLDQFGVGELPRLQASSVIETAVYTWLADLTLGIDRWVPRGFPSLRGHDLERAA